MTDLAPSPAEEGLSSITGWDLPLHHATTGKQLIPGFISAEGDGTRMKLELGIMPHRAKVDAVRVTLLKSSDTRTQDVTFAFKGLK